ncbi:hypothetical protein B0A52_00252 [Exophiala mesophila]|uniref:Uncharacterized protein n=1 Tax=Exophiala mesophila TaxID=212818 RepID=A0A438NJJ6_EXOME|nr:hypothetical protein B0A52_00252 [Exophiala mesophila]
MDNLLYDTSWNLYTISSPTTELLALLNPSTPLTNTAVSDNTETLEKHTYAFRQSLARKRPRYEEQEEKDKIDSEEMRKKPRQKQQPNSSAKTGQKRKYGGGGGGLLRGDVYHDADDDDDNDSTREFLTGTVINMIYDKTTYRFVLLTTTTTTTSPLDSRSTTKKARTTRLSPRNRIGSHNQDLQSVTNTNTNTKTILLLAKCNPSTYKSLTTYLDTTFSIPDTCITPLKPSAQFLQYTLETYISSTYKELTRHGYDNDDEGDSGDKSLRTPLRSANFKSIFGSLHMTISFAPPVAPKLKSLDVELPSETLLIALNEKHNQNRRDDSDGDGDGDDDNKIDRQVTTVVAQWIENRTGLKLPLTQQKAMTIEENKSHDDVGKENRTPDFHEEDTAEKQPSKEVVAADETNTTTNSPLPTVPPMRLSRIMSAAYAISSEGRLKFSAKAMEMCEHDQDNSGHDPDESDDIHDENNLVRRANDTLLREMLREAGRQNAE